MEMRSGPEVSGRNRQVAADQGWSLRGVPLYSEMLSLKLVCNNNCHTDRSKTDNIYSRPYFFTNWLATVLTKTKVILIWFV